MQGNLSGLALVASLAAVGLAGYVLLQDRAGPSELEPRLAGLEDQVGRIERKLAERAGPQEPGPTLLGLGAPPAATAAAAQGGATTRPPALAAPLADAREEGAADPANAPEALRALVDAAVEKKAAQFQAMRNKKPSLDVFATTLALTDPQRRAAEQEVLRAQRDIRAIIELPSADGTNFLDEFVEVMADGIAHPGKDPGRGQKLYGRLLSERIPGGEETYATRVEAIKQAVRETFRRDWTRQQYAVFEAWAMDPTEIKGIEGSPFKDVEARVFERAKELGADLPASRDR